MVTITELKRADKKALKDIVGLIKQLRRNRAEHRGSLNDIRDIVADKKTFMVVAKDGVRIVGMGTLYGVRKVGKHVGHIEDVVVDTAYRGQGLGKKIMQALVAQGKKRKLDALYLTSHAKRGPANKLYTKLGFKLVKTNPYKLEF